MRLTIEARMNNVPSHRHGRSATSCAFALAALGSVTAGCAALAPGALPPGTPIAQARQTLLAPTGEYRLPGGGTRLEYAQGSFGRQTYMLDFDASGVLVASRQVLTEDEFAAIVPGMAAGDVRMRLGRPAQVFGVAWQHLQIWNYRWFGGDCVWFQVSVSDAAQQVTEAGIGTDPACDGPRSPRE
jgi:hypothetical protein